jgi:GT2 family glycosyltransferase
MERALRDVSVIICTYTLERWAALCAAIESVYAQSVQAREVIIVVDHNPDLAARLGEQWPEAILVENHDTRGLSGARNTGISLAQGAYLAFLDDDAVAEPNWLEKLTDCCRDPQVLGAGARVTPVWEGRRPSWLPEEFYWIIGCTYRGLPLTQAPVRNLFGGSMCLRREVFSEVGGFRTNIGRIGNQPLGCEETELCIRAQQHWPQKNFLYEPAVRIHHWVPAKRTRWSYFRARCYAEGQSKALVSQQVGVSAGLASEWTYVRKTLPQGVLRGVREAFFARDPMGLARAGAILAGLVITVAGYFRQWLVQKIVHRPNRRKQIALATQQPEG